MVADLAVRRGDTYDLHFHTGQLRAWQSEARFVVVLAGTQSGKSVFGPHWLYREIGRRGPGAYIVAAPSFPLLEVKAVPAFRRVFEDDLALGTYTSSPVRKFVFSEAGEILTFGERQSEPTVVYFGYAGDPDSLEAMTAKGAWLDEAGQKRFKGTSFEAIMRRLSIAEGRILITTTPYDLGYLKQRFYDRWKAGDTSIDVISFDSTENPAFPRAEFERAREDLPSWKFNMFYRGRFERPAGLIYDVFDEEAHVIPPMLIPDRWERFLGLDFGGVNTVGLFYAAEPGTDRLFLYREYRASGRTAKEHTEALLKGEPSIPTCVGGSKSEGQWRAEFRAAGLPVREPAVTDVEVGIDRVYGAHKRGEIVVFNTCSYYLEQKMTYSRVLDESGEPTEAIEDKEQAHAMDAERYIVGWLRRKQSTDPGALPAGFGGMAGAVARGGRRR